MIKGLRILALVVFVVPSAAFAQQPTPPARPQTVCGVPIPAPASLPPTDVGPVVYQIAPCFEAQGNASLIDIQTYLYYMQIKDKASRPSQNIWVPYAEDVEQIMREDFKRLWSTNFLDNLSIETQDYAFSNGVVGKIIV